METNMAKLKETYAAKKSHLKGMEEQSKYEPDLMGLWPLFDEAYLQKEELENSMSNLKQLLNELRSVRKAHNFAVDAPDGESDGHLEEELLEVEHIMEDTTAAQNWQTPREFAVDGPDGQSDALEQQELQAAQQLASERHPQKIRQQHAMEHQVQKDRARDPEHDW